MSRGISFVQQSKDPEELIKLRKEFQDTTMVQYAKYFEAKVVANTASPFLVGGDLTIADLSLKSLVEAVEVGMWDHIDKTFFNSYPGLV